MMKKSLLAVVSLSAVLFMSDYSVAADELTQLKGPYFGQKQPELTAQVFAPGMVSLNGRHEYGISFSPALDEVYFSTQKLDDVAAIYTSRVERGIWQPIEKLNLTNSAKAGEMHPFVSRHGQTLYFTAYNADFTDTKIWQVSREINGWGSAKKLLSPINDEEVFYSTLADNGDLFYSDIYKFKTFYSPIKNGEYSEIFEVPIAFGLHPFISAERDYLLVDAVAKDKQRKDKDIYVYFKQKDGSWTDAINLGEAVNSPFYETVPSVTPDGKYLFFSRYDEEGGEISNLYWISTQVIERLRPTK